MPGRRARHRTITGTPCGITVIAASSSAKAPCAIASGLYADVWRVPSFCTEEGDAVPISERGPRQHLMPFTSRNGKNRTCTCVVSSSPSSDFSLQAGHRVTPTGCVTARLGNPRGIDGIVRQYSRRRAGGGGARWWWRRGHGTAAAVH